ncbi:hypothetical protein MASR2M48_20340 [Spirochaetota bacterium]
MKIANKIALSVGSLVIAISGALGTTAVSIGSASIRTQVMDHLQTQAIMGAKLVGKGIESNLAILQELADRARTRTMDWPIQQDSLIPDLNNHEYLDIGVVNLEGISHYVSDGSKATLTDRDYIIASLAGRRAISDVLISRVTKGPVVMLAVPIHIDGTVTGALIARKDG